MSDPQGQEEKNEVIANRFHTDIFQKGDLSAADQILAENFVWRNPNVPSDLAHGPEGVKKIASVARDAMPDLNITHDSTLSKGDEVFDTMDNDWYTKERIFWNTCKR
jgi:predicted SnoaL-like aldol condensation-catalyzing enzyme